MVSASEGWAVGHANPYDSDGGATIPTGFILHYTGGAWQLARTIPNVSLNTISMGSATDGWAGGSQVSLSTTTHSPPPVANDQTSALWHFSNGEWAPAALPTDSDKGPFMEEIIGVTMFSATDGWLIAATQLDQTLDNSTRLADAIFQFEGGQWKEIPRPRFENRRRVGSWGHNPAAFLSPTDFWLVGTSIWWPDITSGNAGDTPFIARYHDGAWTIIEY